MRILNPWDIFCDTYDSPVGRIESGWQYAGDAVTYTITVPCNLTAEVVLPDGRNLTLQPGTHTL